MFTFEAMKFLRAQYLFVFLMASSLVISCGSEEIVQQKNVYYPWESYLTKEIAYVTKGANRLQKSVILDGEKRRKDIVRSRLEKRMGFIFRSGFKQSSLPNSL